MIKFLEEVEKLVGEYSETELTNWYYDGIFGSVTIEGNPYEGQIWGIISELAYIDGVKKIELSLAGDKDEDYDILDVNFIEIRPKKTIEELKAELGMK